MKLQPKVNDLNERPYIAIRSEVKMQDIPTTLPPLIPEILDWVKNKKAEQVGPVFFRYLKMDGGSLLVDVGVPVSKPLKGDGRVISDSFPSGKYASATYFGPYDNLNKVHLALEKWGHEQNLNLRGSRTEFYPTDPDTEPDPQKWQTDIEVLVLEE